MNESATTGSGSSLGETVERLRRAADVVQARGLTATVRYRAMGPNQLAGWLADAADEMDANGTGDWRASEYADAALTGRLTSALPANGPTGVVATGARW